MVYVDGFVHNVVDFCRRRFGRLGQVMRAWCPTGIRPLVSQQIVREYVYAYAAVALQLGLMTALVLPYANTEMMNLFLEQVSEEFKDYFLIMQVDGAEAIAQRI